MDSPASGSGGFGSAGSAELAVTRVQVAALYERDSGMVRRMHVVTTLGGAEPVDEAELVADLWRAHDDSEGLDVIVSDNPAHAADDYRVDPVRKIFVAAD